MELLRYVHLNPVRPRDKQAPVPFEKADALRQYAWSSHLVYLGLATAPEWLCTEWLSFFGKRRKEAQREYERFVKDAFGEALASPWRDLKHGLVLGGEELLERVRGLVGKTPGREELRWMISAENPETRRKAAQALAGSIVDRRVRV
jgi:hypothetical protein